MKQSRHLIAAAVMAATTILSFSCNQLKLYNFDHGEVIATVGERELYASDVTPLIESGVTSEDSIKMVEAIAQRWIRRELRTQAAASRFEEEQQDIEAMVQEYRNSLLEHKYEQEWLRGRMDTTVTDAQITEYYNANRDNFHLAGPIVKARVARVPAGLRQSKKLEEMFNSPKPEEQENFMNICQKNQYRYEDFSSAWNDFSTVVSRIPFTQNNFDEFLKERKYYEVEDDQYKYMLKIESYRPTGDLSPIERERANIRKIVINKRRQTLLSAMEDSLYSAAVSEKLFEIKITK